MRARATLVPAAAVLLVGALAAGAAAGVPLREWLPAPFLAAALWLVPARGRAAAAATALLAVSLLLPALCVLRAAADTPLHGAGLAAAAALLAPSVVRGLGRLRADPHPGDLPVVTGAALLACCATGAALVPHGGAAAHPAAALAARLLAALFCWFAVRGLAAASLAGARASALAALLLVTGLGVLAGARCHAAARQAADLERRGAHARAFAAAREARARATALGLPGAALDALRSQARAARALGHEALWQQKTRELLRLRPGDAAAGGALLQDSLRRSDLPEAAALLVRLDRPALPAGQATALACFAAQTTNLAALARAWRADAEPACVFAALEARNLAAVGSRAAFAGEPALAEAFLRAALDRAPADAPSRALLAALCLDSGRAAAARSLAEQGADARLVRAVDAAAADAAAAPGFGPALRLERCALLAPEVDAGGELSLAFRWRVTRPLDPAWRVFVHVRQAAYQGPMLQEGHDLPGTDDPTGPWLAGTLEYTRRVPIPPTTAPGRYRVLVGVWDGQQRLAVTGAGAAPGLTPVPGDQVWVGTLTVRADGP